ncbi:MAG TPA: oligosaccharide flippase family protein [Rhodothermales bacterium]|nr:oligosaccharide flippase family protein [Rhodothermales bacterium]
MEAGNATQHSAAVLRNASMSAFQVVVNAGVLVVLYPFLIHTIGREDFGIWALVMAWTSAGGLAGLGLSGAAVKFTSKYLARGERDRVLHVVQTAVLSVGLLMGIALVCFFPLSSPLLSFLLDTGGALATAKAIIPFAFISFWLLSLSGVLTSTIDGCHKMYLRSLIMAGSSVAYLCICFAVVPRFGIRGLVAAQVLQNAGIFIATWITLRRLLPGLPLIPWQWRRDVFKEMIGYSLNFQAVSIFMLLFEPVTKSLIARYAGVSMVTPYEAAQRVAIQLRALIVSAHMAVVPLVAELTERDPGRIRAVYTKSYHLLIYLTAPLLPFLIGAAPLISRIWLGTYDPFFVRFADILFVGWFLNVLCNPAYFANLGTGDLRWNVRGHFLIALLNVTLGVSLGWFFGATGVVIGFACALICGSALIAFSYQREHAISIRELFSRDSLYLIAAGVAGMAVMIFGYRRLSDVLDLPWLTVLLLPAYAAFIAAPLWRHSTRYWIYGWLREFLTGRLHTAKPATGNA